MLDIAFASDPSEAAADAASHDGVAASPSVLRAERQLRMLEELAQIGMDLARALGRRAEADGVEAASDASCKAAPPARDPADAFQRLSRAIRLTLAMETRTDETLRALQAGEATAGEIRREVALHRAETAKEERRTATEEKVREFVFDAIAAELEDVEARVACDEAMEERLDEDEAYEDFADRPVRETVERLCADLGLSPDWSAWRDETGWIAPGPFGRPAYSPFNQPSRLPIRNRPPPTVAFGPRLE